MSAEWRQIPDTEEDLGDCIIGKWMATEFVVHQRSSPVLGWVLRADNYMYYTPLDAPSRVQKTDKGVVSIITEYQRERAKWKAICPRCYCLC